MQRKPLAVKKISAKPVQPEVKQQSPERKEASNKKGDGQKYHNHLYTQEKLRSLKWFPQRHQTTSSLSEEAVDDSQKKFNDLDREIV